MPYRTLVLTYPESDLLQCSKLKYLQLRSTFGWSLSNLMALLQQQLFVLPWSVDMDLSQQLLAPAAKSTPSSESVPH
jgi:hypothetical protein